MARLSFTLSFLSLSALLASAEPIHFPLRRTGSRKAVDLEEIARKVSVKYGFQTRPVPRARRASSSSVPTVNQDVDASYFATMNVGTPPQALGVILDTGSSDLWFAGTSCTSCAGQIPVFDPTKSSSFQGGTASASSIGGGTPGLGSSIPIQYGSGSVEGALSEDTVSMGGFSISNQKFLVVDEIEGNILVADPQGASGLLGLAFTDLAQTEATPFWLALTNGNQFSSPEISFFLSRSSDPNVQDVPGGVFTLGGTNSSLFTGDIEFHNIPTSPLLFWSTQLQTVKVNGQAVSTQTPVQAAIDTGTSLIAGPTADVEAIWAAVPGSGPSPSQQGFFNFPCASVPAISLSFGGNDWPISPLDLVFTEEPTDTTKCIGTIFAVTVPANSQTPTWIIGDTFLKNVYTVFRSNPPSVGFAQLSSAAGGSSSGTGSTSISQNQIPTGTPSVPLPGLPTPSQVTTFSTTTQSSTSAGVPSTSTDIIQVTITTNPSSPTSTGTGTGGAAQSDAVSTTSSLLFILVSAVLGCMLNL